MKPKTIRKDGRREAHVLSVKADRVTIMCPYCLNEHEHHRAELYRVEFRAAACDLYYPISTAQRVAGYYFTATDNDRQR